MKVAQGRKLWIFEATEVTPVVKLRRLQANCLGTRKAGVPTT